MTRNEVVVALHCNGAVLTDLANGKANVTSPHNHIRDQGQINTAKKREEMKALATSTIARPLPPPPPPPPPAIQSDVLLNANNSSTTGGLNPVRYLLHEALYKSTAHRPTAKCRCTIMVVNWRVVIFSTDDNLQSLAAANRWYADGNFKLVPTIFKQVYIIRVKLGATYITVLYCYLQHKSHIAYREMWSIIHRECQQCNLVVSVEHLMVDFEIAVINSFHFVFGNRILLQGCFFH